MRNINPLGITVNLGINKKKRSGVTGKALATFKQKAWDKHITKSYKKLEAEK